MTKEEKIELLRSRQKLLLTRRFYNNKIINKIERRIRKIEKE